MPKKYEKFIYLCLMVLAVAASWYWYDRRGDNVPFAQKQTEQNPAGVTDEPAGVAGFDKSRYSLTTSTSPWVIVNKKNSLPLNYVPADLAAPDVQLRLTKNHEQMRFRKLSHSALGKMFSAAKTEGVGLVFGSGFRSASLQSQFYNSYVAKDGRTAADRYSARPGHSEHQTGLAVDITSPAGTCHLQDCFKDTPQGRWIAANAHRFGFIIRYPKGKEAVTGYTYEPWHLRFVGTDLASQLRSSGQVMEEFFELPSAANYD